MPALSDYTAGTITLTNNSTAFTGTGTAWQAADFREGDVIFQVAGQTQWTAVVQTITSNTAGTLVRPWGGATGTYAYRMRYMADGARVTAQARNLIELLGNGNLQAEAGIDGTGGNWLSYYTGAGTKARTALTPAARELLGLPAAANKVPYYTDANTADLTDLTAKGRSILAQTNNAGVLTEIGAQPALGYTPVNKAGDTMTGVLRNTAHPVLRATRNNNAETFLAGQSYGLIGAMAVNQGGFTQGGTIGSDAGRVVHVPATGYYAITVTAFFTAGGGGRLNVIRNGSGSDVIAFAQSWAGANHKVVGIGVALLTAGDHLAFHASQADISIFTAVNHTEVIAEYLG